MGDDELRKLAGFVVDELLGRLASRPANDTFHRERRRARIQPAADVDPAEVQAMRDRMRRKGLV